MARWTEADVDYAHRLAKQDGYYDEYYLKEDKMDPNATLTRIREITAMFDNSEYESADIALEYGDELGQLVTSLDEWLSKGGFLPEAWAKVPKTMTP